VQERNGSLLFSLSDLNAFLECEHLTQLEFAVARHQLERPRDENPQADLVKRKGDKHEAAYLARLVSSSTGCPVWGREVALSAVRGEALEPTREAVAIGSPRTLARQLDLLVVKRLEQIKHRTVLVLEKAPRDVHAVIRSDANEILIEGTVMNRAQAQPVCDVRISLILEIADDVRSIEQTRLAETTDRTATLVGNEYPPAKARLVESNARLANRVLPLKRIC
jgi:hypothetical protein